MEMKYTPRGLATLHWNVWRRANVLGIYSIPDLARAISGEQPDEAAGESEQKHKARQSLYRICKDDSKNVKVETLERLCLTLTPNEQPANPGDWFRWEGGHLVWNIRQLAEQYVGVKTAAQFSRAFQFYPQQGSLFWDGTAQFVFVRSLALMATVIRQHDGPFDIGDLFTWTTPVPFAETLNDNAETPTEQRQKRERRSTRSALAVA